MRTLARLLIAALAPISLAQAVPDIASSPVVGYQEIACPGGSDTVISVPFERPVTFRGTIIGLASGAPVVTLAGGDPGFAENELASTHFLRFTGGNAAGRHYPIAGNQGAEIRLLLPDGDPALTATAGDGVDLIPCWTPESLFPAASQAALHPSSGLLPGQRGSELLMYPSGSVPENASPDRVFFVTSSGWFEADSGIPAADDAVLPPHAVLVIRHPDHAAQTWFRPAALVTTSPSGMVLKSRRGSALDHFVSLNRPIPAELGQLITLARALTPSPGLSPSQRRDLLLVFDNATADRDRQPSATYFFHRGDWYRATSDGQPPQRANDANLPAGAVLVIRKAPTLNPRSTVWTQDPNL